MTPQLAEVRHQPFARMAMANYCAARARMRCQLRKRKSGVISFGKAEESEFEMDLAQKRTAVLVRSYRQQRTNLEEVSAWAVELGLSTDDFTTLLEQCAGVTRPSDRVGRLTAMLVEEYDVHQLPIDYALGYAIELGFHEHELRALIDACGDADLRRVA